MKLTALLIPVLCGVAAAQTCRIDTIVGTYLVSYTGTMAVMIPNAPPANYSGAIFGILSIGSDSKVTGAAAVAGLGPVTDYEVAGRIEFKPDCTGTIWMTVAPKGSTATETEVDRFFFLRDTSELRVIVVDMGPGVYPALLGTWKRIAPYPDAVAW